MTESPDTEPAVDQDGRVVLTGISSRAFEHPADRAALTALRAVPGFDQVIRVASGMLRERQYRLVHLSSSVRVDERQFSRLHELLGEVVTVLDTERPELYVYNDPFPNAITLGVDRPFVAMSSSLYDLLDDDERRFVLGHEVGHALSGHALYQSMLLHLLNLIGSLGWIPASGLALRAIVAALREWQRKAELSGDRAGLLATQDPAAALRLHMKTAGGAHLDQIDADAFLAQAAEYESTGDLRDGVLKLLNTERTTHPFAVVRAAELRRWSESEEYAAILRGQYPRRGDDHTATFGENAREAARSYKQRIDESTDPLITTVRNVGANVGTGFASAADSIADWFARRARPGTDQQDTGGDVPADGAAGGTGTQPPDNEPPAGPPPAS
ncbi:Zn-dependent protease with chaperone function [Jatrophihabitans endophyticus]|uniref:Zn-dependent protease with chaperone function n=1 Tax=Jatrophihabitans endophyticus TaxID=1206085 RepID=A0A1M5HTF4_9ACTN|nr:M48 family metallopeptidase [Jatrophihabitans endophyticus]SHG19217.1 Zn-dependent protease with chaperone function [Jatrophihabitans endophyticus]